MLKLVELNNSQYYTADSVEQLLKSLNCSISRIEEVLNLKRDNLSKVQKKQILIQYFNIKKIKVGLTVNDLSLFCTEFEVDLSFANLKGLIKREIIARNENNKVAVNEWLYFLDIKFPEWSNNKKAQTLQSGLQSKGNNDGSL